MSVKHVWQCNGCYFTYDTKEEAEDCPECRKARPIGIPEVEYNKAGKVIGITQKFDNGWDAYFRFERWF